MQRWLSSELSIIATNWLDSLKTMQFAITHNSKVT